MLPREEGHKPKSNLHENMSYYVTRDNIRSNL